MKFIIILKIELKKFCLKFDDGLVYVFKVEYITIIF